MNIRIVILFAFMFMTIPLLDAHAERTTRDLVFEDEPQAAEASQKNEQTIALKTTILLKRNGQTNTVLPTHEFKSGDSVKLVFTPSVDGYAYWMAKGSSGTYAVLFPGAKTGQENAVQRNIEYTVPVKGWFKFDEKVGSEELLCIISTRRLSDIDNAIAELTTQSDKSTKQIAAVEEKNAAARTTRDLVFEDEDGEDVNTKKQTATHDEPFVAHFVLSHK